MEGTPGRVIFSVWYQPPFQHPVFFYFGRRALVISVPTVHPPPDPSQRPCPFLFFLN